MKQKIAIVGSRNITDYEIIKTFVLSYIDVNNIEWVCSGGARGVDSLAEQFADEFNIPKKIFLADWDQFGKQAGFLRNFDIITNSDIVFAIWDGVSKGTQHSMSIAKKQNKILYTKIINM
jgi:hypothetical protein